MVQVDTTAVLPVSCAQVLQVWHPANKAQQRVHSGWATHRASTEQARPLV
ncbi:hypothetical protein BDA96_05G241000 [Sorghum bicolor]|uniref:Uncharacterized protein n=2 Tax=Sorghum bicolor TaxID=4558 RepID=A0A921QZD5_SORBI|nr:hypothetical protein BDA96_05G241000 [Sorghum bicolor]KXG27936.1 hypothetical protein SORBI_3005G065600 [Sorghum bicolor]